MSSRSFCMGFKLCLICLVLFSIPPFSLKALARAAAPDTTQTKYFAELKATGNAFIRPFRQNYVLIYSLPEKDFLARMDSSRAMFFVVIARYQNRLNSDFVKEQQSGINYYFDQMLADYPETHYTYTGNAIPYESEISRRLKHNLADFNNPDFRDYGHSFFSFELNYELKKPAYQGIDNRELNAIFNIIAQLITNAKCSQYWQYDYLYNHIDNKGIKNIEKLYNRFMVTCTDTIYRSKVKTLYDADYRGRQGHLIKIYKTAGPFKLDMHLFLPDSAANGKKRPVMVYFHGGSWSEGKPDWFFEACKSDARKGWVACAVEYRIYGREGTLPFEAVKDARSAIRWLRQHAAEYNIDTNRIVASGNSSGGHLALCCAMADKYNEKTDDLRYSPVPNLLMVNSAVYDLTDLNTAWIRKDLKDKDLVKEISPDFLVKKGLPPILAIHGTKDTNVPYAGAKLFETEMMNAGNRLEFYPLEGATHFLWLDPKYAGQADRIQEDFLKKYGY
jgi:acetyl esterase/lipase